MCCVIEFGGIPCCEWLKAAIEEAAVADGGSELVVGTAVAVETVVTLPELELVICGALCDCTDDGVLANEVFACEPTGVVGRTPGILPICVIIGDSLFVRGEALGDGTAGGK